GAVQRVVGAVAGKPIGKSSSRDVLDRPQQGQVKHAIRHVLDGRRPGDRKIDLNARIHPFEVKPVAAAGLAGLVDGVVPQVAVGVRLLDDVAVHVEVEEVVVVGGAADQGVVAGAAVE